MQIFLNLAAIAAIVSFFVSTISIQQQLHYSQAGAVVLRDCLPGS
jgi:hypothetical protein